MLGTLAGMETVVRQQKRPPRILEISWGHIEVEGLGAGKDFKLYPGGGRAWDWAETGTRHSPGIQPADVEELLACGATIVVLSQGMDKQLQGSRSHPPLPGTARCHGAGGRDSRGVKIYNDLAEDALVAGLFHSTC